MKLILAQERNEEIILNRKRKERKIVIFSNRSAALKSKLIDLVIRFWNLPRFWVFCFQSDFRKLIDLVIGFWLLPSISFVTLSFHLEQRRNLLTQKWLEKKSLILFDWNLTGNIIEVKFFPFNCFVKCVKNEKLFLVFSLKLFCKVF